MPRNPLIADLFPRLRRVERAGTGITRIRQSLAEAGLPPPEFESGFFFTVRFPLTETPGNVPPDHGPDHGAGAGTMLALSRDQVEALRLCREPQPSAALMAALGRSDRTKFRQSVLRPLIEAELLRLTQPDRPRSKLQQYVTTAAGRQRLESEKF